jgi:5-methylcytosine-specific restriction protein A
MEITPELTPSIYAIAKSVYEEDITLAEGKRQLVGDIGMNESSAVDFISALRHMLDGAEFTRTINAYSIEYFLQNIFKDYGAEALSNALKALNLHILNYENIRHTQARKTRGIYETYLAKLPLELRNEIVQNEFVQKLRNHPKTREELILELNNLIPYEGETTTTCSKAFKRDNYAIALIKELRCYRCQICKTRIRKKDGSFYVEAAHIVPKNKQGPETPDNILLLCPNHHKEFDLGERTILYLGTNTIKITLNGQQHTLSLEIK